jgi:hypothetical protein
VDNYIQNPVVGHPTTDINNSIYERNKMGTKNILKKMNYIDKKMMNRQQRRKLERERKKKIKGVMEQLKINNKE